MGERDNSSIKKMAEMLRQGATMLAQQCPNCGAPLMKVGDEVHCVACEQQFSVSKKGTPDVLSQKKGNFAEMRTNLIRKIGGINDLLAAENDVDRLTKIARLLVLLLQALEKTDSV